MQLSFGLKDICAREGRLRGLMREAYSEGLIAAGDKIRDAWLGTCQSIHTAAETLHPHLKTVMAQLSTQEITTRQRLAAALQGILPRTIASSEEASAYT